MDGEMLLFQKPRQRRQRVVEEVLLSSKLEEGEGRGRAKAAEVGMHQLKWLCRRLWSLQLRPKTS